MENSGGDGKRLEEIFEINRRFLDLIALRVGAGGKNQYGLPPELCARIAKLLPSQRDAVALAPMLLVTADRRAVEDASAVHDAQLQAAPMDENVEVAEQNFAASLLTWLTQDVQQNHSLASLWLGVSGHRHEPVRDLSFSDIQILARYAHRILSACFTDRLQLWKDLVGAARSGDPRRQERARLAALARSCSVQPGLPSGLRRNFR